MPTRLWVCQLEVVPLWIPFYYHGSQSFCLFNEFSFVVGSIYHPRDLNIAVLILCHSFP